MPPLATRGRRDPNSAPATQCSDLGRSGRAVRAARTELGSVKRASGPRQSHFASSAVRGRERSAGGELERGEVSFVPVFGLHGDDDLSGGATCWCGGDNVAAEHGVDRWDVDGRARGDVALGTSITRNSGGDPFRPRSQLAAPTDDQGPCCRPATLRPTSPKGVRRHGVRLGPVSEVA
jgi:hypothetical protein